MSSVPTLVAPKPQEPLLLYLAATNQLVSVALVAQREVDEAESEQRLAESEKDQDISEHDNESNPKDVAWKKVVQRPVYFVISLLQGARSRYSGVQKLIFGLIMASRKLRHYFQAHEITVVTPIATDTLKPRGHWQDSGVGFGAIQLWFDV